MKKKKNEDRFELKEENKKRYLNSRYLFSIYDGVMLWAARIVMPISSQKQVLNDFLIVQPGSSHIKSLMRSYVYWLNMDTVIEELVKPSRNCSLAAKAKPIMFSNWPVPR